MSAQKLPIPDTAFRSRRTRQPRFTDESHLAYIRRLPCLVTGRRGAVDAAHIRFADPRFGKRATGMGERPDDKWTIPLCRAQHEAQHAGDERHYWATVGIDPIQVAAALALNSGDDEAAEMILAAWRMRAAG